VKEATGSRLMEASRRGRALEARCSDEENEVSSVGHQRAKACQKRVADSGAAFESANLQM
jgi:hypothetical protein